MIKLYKARSLLYRRQLLQENIRWKALDEIYYFVEILHVFAPLRPQYFRKKWQTFSHFRQNVAKFTKLNFRKNFIDTSGNRDEIRKTANHLAVLTLKTPKQIDEILLQLKY